MDSRWKVPNPNCPELHCLRKIHKENDPKAMRPISANTNAPTEKMAKWLVRELKSISKENPPFNFSVKNSMEFATQIEDLELEENEILMSFDVVSLYPSIPVEETLSLFEEWLMECNIPDDKKKVYLRFARFAMRNSYFKFRGKYYRQPLVQPWV